MNETNIEKDNALSPLRMEHIVFNKLFFERKGFAHPGGDVQFQARKNIEKMDDSVYLITLNIVAEKKDEYSAEVDISGYCTIAEDHPLKRTILEKNAVAILFPYARTQLTLLTSQPETMPIVLPAVNINKMFEEQ